jgi:hypothetical protein
LKPPREKAAGIRREYEWRDFAPIQAQNALTAAAKLRPGGMVVRAARPIRRLWAVKPRLNAIGQINGGSHRLDAPFTLTIRLCSTLGSMTDDKRSHRGADLLLVCLAVLIFSAVVFMGFQITASP